MHKEKQDHTLHIAKICCKFSCSRRVLILVLVLSRCLQQQSSRFMLISGIAECGPFYLQINYAGRELIFGSRLRLYFYYFSWCRGLFSWQRRAAAEQGTFWGRRCAFGRRKVIGRGRWVAQRLSDSSRLILASLCVREVIHSLGWRSEQMRWKPLSPLFHVNSGVNILKYTR